MHSEGVPKAIQARMDAAIAANDAHYRACELTADAAWSGDLDKLKSLRAEGHPWDERVTCYAAKHGHMEILQWAFDNNAPCSANVYLWAEDRNDAFMMNWALERGLPTRY